MYRLGCEVKAGYKGSGLRRARKEPRGFSWLQHVEHHSGVTEMRAEDLQPQPYRFATLLRDLNSDLSFFSMVLQVHEASG